MEMVDIINSSDGSLVGKQTSKKEAHEKGLWHRTAHIWFLNNNGEILLQKRADNIESYPGKWDISAAGHLSAGDTNLRGALREVKEELGVELEEKDLIKIGEIKKEETQHNGNYIDKEYKDVYVVCKDLLVSDFIIQESEVSFIKYIKVEEFKKWVKEKRKDLVDRPEDFEFLFNYLDTKK